jgi:hypothetical protein
VNVVGLTVSRKPELVSRGTAGTDNCIGYIGRKLFIDYKFMSLYEKPSRPLLGLIVMSH